MENFRVGMVVRTDTTNMGFVSVVAPFCIVVVPFGSSIGERYHFPSLLPADTKDGTPRTTEEVRLIDHPANIGFLIPEKADESLVIVGGPQGWVVSLPEKGGMSLLRPKSTLYSALTHAEETSP